MKIHLLFFSLLRDISGSEQIKDYSFEGQTIGDLLAQLFREFPGLDEWDEKLLIAVNCEYADRETQIQEGDEVALMPPVQGG